MINNCSLPRIENAREFSKENTGLYISVIEDAVAHDNEDSSMNDWPDTEIHIGSDFLDVSGSYCSGSYCSAESSLPLKTSGEGVPFNLTSPEVKNAPLLFDQDKHVIFHSTAIDYHLLNTVQDMIELFPEHCKQSDAQYQQILLNFQLYFWCYQ